MILLARGVTRLATFIVLVALAVVGAAAAVGSTTAGTGDVSLPGFSRLLDLGRLEDTVGRFIATLEAPGSTAVYSALGGAAAIALGLFLLVGLFWPRRERLVVLERDDDGELAARRRALNGVAAELVAGVRDVRPRKTRVRPARRGRVGGRLKVRALSNPDATEPRADVDEALTPLTDDLGLRPKVRVRRQRRRRS